MKKPITRAWFAVLALAAAPFAAQAQTPTLHYFEATGPVDRVELKMLISALEDEAPGTEVFLSDAGTILKVLPVAGLDEATVRAAIVRSGVALLPGTPDMALLLAPPPAPGARPVYVVTGDAAADAQRYRDAVQQWNTAHPDAPMALPPHANAH